MVIREPMAATLSWASGIFARLPARPHASLVAGVVLAVAALAEVGARLKSGQLTLVRVRADQLGVAAVTIDGQRLTVQLVVVLCAVTLLSTLPLGLRQPGLSAVTICAACVVSLTVVHLLTTGGVLAQLLAAYRLGHSGSRALWVVVGLPFLPLALEPPRMAGDRVLSILLAALVPTLAAAGAARLAGRDISKRGFDAERLAGDLLAHTARDERTRIARELHDVVAHHISMISVQAETARLTVPGMPEPGAEQLRGIADTARTALTEMRRLLGVLREDPESEPESDRQPQPGLRQLTSLLDEVRDGATASVRLILTGASRPLDPGVELATYRIVQESLTNARRHAPGAPVDVELAFTRTTLHLRIRDNGPGPTEDDQPGLGLLGIRERAAAVGGQVRIGPAAGGGFQVVAALPTKEAGR